jgi:hypothetical protein
MWRAFFLSLGVIVFIVGLECLGVQKFVLKPSRDALGAAQAAATVLTPPDWAPWSLMSTGAVVCLYCFTVPRMGG